ncbi:MAG: Hpt domain-containing protein [Thermodesulfobacteriota bacterium]|nr:Hpt domain-containing protein [Thermodesulfobacteriota bacterium]
MGEASDNGVEAINIEELMEIMDNDDELINECFHDFLEELPVLFKDLKSAVVNKNSSRLNSTAHSLKGTLKYLAAETAADTAYRLELAGKENDFVNVGQDLEQLLHECRQIELFIKNYKN